MGLLIWSVAFLLCFAGIGLAAGGPSAQRRSYFWLRLVLFPAMPAGLVLILGALLPVENVHALSAALVLLAIPTLMFVPALLYRNSGYPPSSGEDDGGGGPGPDPPPSRPTPPRGGIPLPDARPARARIRDHNRPKLTDRRLRRPAREPGRRRAPARA